MVKMIQSRNQLALRRLLTLIENISTVKGNYHLVCCVQNMHNFMCN